MPEAAHSTGCKTRQPLSFGYTPKTFGTFDTGPSRGFSENEWPEPKPLPEGLLPVATFDPAFLPEAFAPWVMDTADRMQCPPEFVAIPAIVAEGSVLGRKVGIQPEQENNWLEVSNLWGNVVGRPGTLKTPAMQAGLEFVRVLNEKRPHGKRGRKV
jgi:Protein of unknown function (DUF3987)